MELAQIGMWIGIILGLASLLAVTVKVWRGVRRVSHFLDDWFGEPQRPGVPARPGVMERIEALEHDVGVIKTHVGMEGVA